MTTIARDAASARTVPELGALLRQLRRREARQREGTVLSYREFAAKTGWSHTIIGEYFNGKALPPTDRFDQLLRLLGVTGAELNMIATARDRVEELRRPGCPPAVRPTARRVPRELPAPVPRFVGRWSYLSELDRLTDNGSDILVVAAVCGGGGVGKTALVVHWAHRRLERFPDGQLYLDLRGHSPGPPVSTGDGLGRLLSALGVEPERMPAGSDDRATLYRTLMAGRRMLVVLDNAVSADHVRSLLPGSSTSMVVVTSRDSLAGLVVADGAQRIELDALTDVEASTLVHTLLDSRINASSEDAHALVRLCGGLPLALRVAAEVAGDADESLADLLADLSDHRECLNRLDAGDSRSAVRSVLSWSYRALSPAAARLFRLLGCEPGPDLSVAAVASLGDLEPVLARRTLIELVRAHMLAETAPGRYSMNDVLRTYAADVAADESPDERRAAERRLLDHYLHTAVAAERTLAHNQVAQEPAGVADVVEGAVVTTFPSRAAARAWFAAERLTLVAAVRLAGDRGFADHAWRLAWIVASLPSHRGRRRERSAINAVGHAEAKDLGGRVTAIGSARRAGRAGRTLDRHAR